MVILGAILSQGQQGESTSLTRASPWQCDFSDAWRLMQMNLPDLGGGYLGSRKEKDRYHYLKTNLAGFIELCPNRRIDKDQLNALIEEIPGVKSASEDAFLFLSGFKGFAGLALEFAVDAYGDWEGARPKLWEPEIIFLQHALESYASMVAVDAADEMRSRGRTCASLEDWHRAEAARFPLPRVQAAATLRERQTRLQGGKIDACLRKLSDRSIRSGLLLRGTVHAVTAGLPRVVKLMLLDTASQVLRGALVRVACAGGHRIRIEHIREACAAAPPNGLGLQVYGEGRKRLAANRGGPPPPPSKARRAAEVPGAMFSDAAIEEKASVKVEEESAEDGE